MENKGCGTRQDRISSIIIQDEVPPRSSGALITGRDGEPIVEGVTGFGDEFMLGRVGPSQLDPKLADTLKALHSELVEQVGSVRAEWVFDGEAVWLIQLQQETALSAGWTIVPGEVESEMEFDVSRGLSGLREQIELVKRTNSGIK